MYNEIWAAVIAVVGVLVTCVVTYKISKKSEWCGLVSKNRMDWIISFRSNISKMLANARFLWDSANMDKEDSHLGKMKECINKYIKQHLNNPDNQTFDCCPDYIKASIDYEEAKNEILSRLNLKESLHSELQNDISDLDAAIKNNATFDSFKETEDEILEVTRTILKPEFERVKKEAKGDE
jgi:hypothetical protein